jgi:hypothetical protein
MQYLFNGAGAGARLHRLSKQAPALRDRPGGGNADLRQPGRRGHAFCPLLTADGTGNGFTAGLVEGVTAFRCRPPRPRPKRLLNIVRQRPMRVKQFETELQSSRIATRLLRDAQTAAEATEPNCDIEDVDRGKGDPNDRCDDSSSCCASLPRPRLGRSRGTTTQSSHAQSALATRAIQTSTSRAPDIGRSPRRPRHTVRSIRCPGTSSTAGWRLGRNRLQP